MIETIGMSFEKNIRSVTDCSPKELPLTFEGRGEVRSFSFRQIELANDVYIYEVSDTFGNKWYEVFKKVIDTRFGKISYPKANAFGITAWSCKNLDSAVSKLQAITGRLRR